MPHNDVREEFIKEFKEYGLSIMGFPIFTTCEMVADYWLSKREAEFAALRERFEEETGSMGMDIKHYGLEAVGFITGVQMVREAFYRILPTPTANEKGCTHDYNHGHCLHDGCPNYRNNEKQV